MICACCVVLSGLSCEAKSGGEHRSDMVRIFPFDPDDKISNKKIFSFYDRVNAYLDYATFPNEKVYGKKVGHPIFLGKYETLRGMKFANHRIWYHWGFNADPRKFNPLVSAVKSNIQEGRLKPDYEHFFWEKLNQSISERNKVLLSEWAKASGYSGLRQLSKIQRDQSNAFVTLLISIHLLGDHTTSETSVIIDRNTLYAEIFTAIDKIAGKKDADNMACARSLKNKLKRVKGNPAKFLDVLANNFTEFLYELNGEECNYKKKFKKLGYKLK